MLRILLEHMSKHIPQNRLHEPYWEEDDEEQEEDDEEQEDPDHSATVEVVDTDPAVLSSG